MSFGGGEVVFRFEIESRFFFFYFLFWRISTSVVEYSMCIYVWGGKAQMCHVFCFVWTRNKGEWPLQKSKKSNLD
jgi:hypothetical protein